MNQQEEDTYCDSLDHLIDNDASVDEFVSALNNDITIFDMYLFQYACRCGNLPIAQWLYENRTVRLNGYLPDSARPRTEHISVRTIPEYICNDKTAMSEAIYFDHFHIVRWLLSLPNIETYFNTDNEGSERPLCRAIPSLQDFDEERRFPLDIVDALIAKGPVNMLTTDECSPLHYAVTTKEEHQLPLALKLLCAGAPVKESGPELDYSFALDWTKPGSKVENVLQNWNTLMLLYCVKEHGIDVDCDSIVMLSELAFDDEREVEEEEAEEDEEEQEEQEQEDA
jgi:hypothetical protein